MKIIPSLKRIFQYSQKRRSFALIQICVALVIFSCQQEKKEEPYLLGYGHGIHSTTLFVKDLDATSTYWKDTLGFDVPSEEDFEIGPFSGSTIASIFLPDMSLVELLSINDSIADVEIDSTLTHLMSKEEGIQMYSISSSSIDSTKQWLVSQGFVMDSINSYRSSSDDPDGWSWDSGSQDLIRLDFISSDQVKYLPGFVQSADKDYIKENKQWKTYYSYNRRFNEHPNGVVGTVAIRIELNDLEKGKKDFEKMGFKLIEATDSLIRYKLLRNQELQLVNTNETQLTDDNPNSFTIRFEVINLDSTYQYLSERLPEEALDLRDSSRLLVVQRAFANGVQLEFVQEPEEQATIAKILRPYSELDSTAAKYAAEMYVKYCALCHGENREGYAADNAPSLRSHSLLASSQGTNFMRYTIQYGRSGTAMAGYRDLQGGPLEYIEIELLLKWLYDTAGVEEPVKLSREQVLGDVALGSTVYANNCAVCHGKNGEGISAPALGNPMLLATATDHFLRYAIAEGRDGTPMIAFKDSLSEEEIDGVTAFLRSRASGWDIPKPDTATIPSPENYVLNANNRVPDFDLRDNKFVSAAQVNKALKDSLRMIILDARSEVAWRQMHIPGSIPVPYYEEPENFIDSIPNDSTQIVVYCACPHAASERVLNTLKRYGFQNTSIIDEGILVWAQMGYPVQHGN